MTSTAAATTDRAGRRTALALALAALALAAVPVIAARPELRDDDRPVDGSTTTAQRAVAAARAVVPGTLVDLRRDADNGKWEVTLRQGSDHYEVELAADDLALLRIDYD